MRRSPLSRGSKPLRTLTPLKVHKPLVRKKPIQQIGRKALAAGKTVASVVRHRDTGPDQNAVDAILDRAQHSCERCGDSVGERRGTDWHCHHRRPRGSGGSKAADTNMPSNLAVLCPDCHIEVESRRGEAQTDGWLVPQGGNPANVAVLIQLGSRWVYLTADAKYSLHPPKDRRPNQCNDKESES